MTDNDQKEGGLELTPTSLSCLPCRCKRKFIS